MAWQSPSAHNPQDGSGQGGNNGVGQGQGGGNGPQALGTEYTLQGTGCSDQHHWQLEQWLTFGARLYFRCDAILANRVAPSWTGSELLGDWAGRNEGEDSETRGRKQSFKKVAARVRGEDKDAWDGLEKREVRYNPTNAARSPTMAAGWWGRWRYLRHGLTLECAQVKQAGSHR